MKLIAQNANDKETDKILLDYGVNIQDMVEYSINYYDPVKKAKDTSHEDIYFYIAKNKPVVIMDGYDWNDSLESDLYEISYDEFLDMYNSYARDMGFVEIEMTEPGVFKHIKGSLFAFHSEDGYDTVGEYVIVADNLETAKWCAKEQHIHNPEQIEVPENVANFVKGIDEDDPDWLREIYVEGGEPKGFVVSKNVMSRWEQK